jgi:N-acetylmuramoyl-L-alanine amidase
LFSGAETIRVCNFHMSPETLHRPLSYVQRLESRSTDSISLVVIHCTELPDMDMARVWGEKLIHTGSRTGNSGHFYIDRDGSVEAWVPLDRVAHHVRGYNPSSIGIELVNNGRYPDWFKSHHQQMKEPYTDAQIKSLASLLNHLATQLPGLKGITGHQDLDTDLLPSEDQPDIMINRKLDPGPLFPWSQLMAQIPLRRVNSGDL